MSRTQTRRSKKSSPTTEPIPRLGAAIADAARIIAVLDQRRPCPNPRQRSEAVCELLAAAAALPYTQLVLLRNIGQRLAVHVIRRRRSFRAATKAGAR